MRLAWSSDIHLNHAALPAWDDWIDAHRDSSLDGLIITGDISEADDVAFQLQRIAEALSLPIFFVLGNHDFYLSSIASTRRRIASLAREVSALHYLTDAAAIETSPGRFLIGEDGWGDGTEGDYESSPVRLNDFVAIKEFRRAEPNDWPKLLRELGKESADRLERKLNSAINGQVESVLVATHVPPFRESCWYQGQTTDDHWAPFFVCRQVGQVLSRFAQANPRTKITVLCGHTHHAGVAQPQPNLTVLTAAAEYGKPRIAQMIEL